MDPDSCCHSRLDEHSSPPQLRTRSATPLTPAASTSITRLLQGSRAALPCYSGGFSAAVAAAQTGGNVEKSVSAQKQQQQRTLSASGCLAAAGDKEGIREYFNPARRAIYARFTANDWANHNKLNQRQSTKERLKAEQLRAEAWQTVRLTDQRTWVRQSDASNKLKERSQDLAFWINGLFGESRLLSREIASLEEGMRVLDSYLAHSSLPLSIAEECLTHREGRIGIDQVRDDVERQLTREVECIRRCRDQMRRVGDRARLQMKLNREALHELDKDLRNKSHARGIDDRMRQLQNQTPGISLHPGIEAIDNSQSIPDSWSRYSQENVARSQQSRAASEKLRGAIQATLKGCANEMWSQFNAVNAAFNVRIKEITDVRSSLQGQLQRTMSEILAAEAAVSQVRKAIAEKEAPLKVAHTRLDMRGRRVDVESCNDQANTALQREVQEIRDSLRYLVTRLKSLQTALSRLNGTRVALETEIRVKENSLTIDARRCMGMRKTFPVEPTIGPLHGSAKTWH